ncbi:DUF5134 domain-containing protein [Streptomyces sp. MST-110588]|uniref:DUF5134 domain-containing protein n=1 Tax=Streptomyces sp. MST-110588 TaxID=2833628 RepID=UPI001F5DE9CF|nr:DUF5134 domain-containing protein [Streptomyces sp. MST-110588]UNO38936.1 DUF5134 domain-containing protein [Streptomyces sp. MST-110588]
MHGPPWLGWPLVLLCAAAGAYCLSRARTGTPEQRREARGEALMGLGMAAMALPASAVTLPAWSPWAFTVVFGAAGLWSVLRRHPHHLVGASAMVYMALAMGTGPAAGGAGHTGHPVAHVSSSAAPGTPGGLPVLTGLLLAYYAVFAVAAGLRLTPAGAETVLDTGAGARTAAGACTEAGARGGRGGAVVCGVRTARPEVIGACRVAMGIGMFAMLLTL